MINEANVNFKAKREAYLNGRGILFTLDSIFGKERQMWDRTKKEYFFINGERFNPQDFDEWLESYFEPEFNGVSKDALALITDEMKNKMFEAWCERLWSDSANEDNYESPNARDRRAAKKIVENWVDENNWPDKIVVTADNSTIYVLDDDEKEFAESETANLAMLVDGRSKAFIDAYDNKEDA